MRPAVPNWLRASQKKAQRTGQRTGQHSLQSRLKSRYKLISLQSEVIVADGLIEIDDIRMLLFKACDEAGAQYRWAEKNGVSAAYVSDVLSGRRDPGESIAKAFGYEPVTMYRRIERTK